MVFKLEISTFSTILFSAASASSEGYELGRDGITAVPLILWPFVSVFIFSFKSETISLPASTNFTLAKEIQIDATQDFSFYPVFNTIKDLFTKDSNVSISILFKSMHRKRLSFGFSTMEGTIRNQTLHIMVFPVLTIGYLIKKHVVQLDNNQAVWALS